MFYTSFQTKTHYFSLLAWLNRTRCSSGLALFAFVPPSACCLAILNMIGFAYLTRHKEDLLFLWKYLFDVDPILTVLQFYVDNLSSVVCFSIQTAQEFLKVLFHVFVLSASSISPSYLLFTLLSLTRSPPRPTQNCPHFVHGSRFAMWERQSKTIYIDHTEVLGCKSCFECFE